MPIMPFSEDFRKYITKQGYKWVRNSPNLGEIEKIALQYFDTQILHNIATGTYSLYVFGKKIPKAMFGSFEVASIIVDEGRVDIIPKEGTTMSFKDITTFEDEKIERFPEAEETIVEELEERGVPPEQWEDYGISAQTVERVKEKKKKAKAVTLTKFGVEPGFIPIGKGKRQQTLFAFGDHSINVRGVITAELEEALETGLYKGFKLEPEDIDIIREEIRRREQEEMEIEKGILRREESKTTCPAGCSIDLETKERRDAHLKIHHPEIWADLKAEEKAERRRKAKERAKTIPEGAKFIARSLNVDVFTANSMLNRILSMDMDWDIVDWEAIGEVDWKTRHDRDEYLNQIEERVQRYGIILHPVEEATKHELDEMQEEFEVDQLENLLEEIYIGGEDAERVEFLKENVPTLIKMAQRGITRAKVALADFVPEIPMERYLRPEELKGRRGPPKISPKDLKTDREIAKQLDDETLENVLKRRKLFGRVLLKKEAEIFAEELEMRRLAKIPTAPGVAPPTEAMDRERQIAEVKALIAPLLTTQLEDMVNTGIAFDLKLESWALEVIKEELKEREAGIMAVLHGEDYPDVVRLIAEAGTLTQFDDILRNIAERRYRLTPTDELELQTNIIEKRGRREEEVRKPVEEPPKKKEKVGEEVERGGTGLYPDPFIELDVCTACGVSSPNIDFDTRSALSRILGIPIHLFDACQRCVIGVYGYGDILTYISDAVADPRKHNLTRSDLDWLRKVEYAIQNSPMAVMFAVGLETAESLGKWLYSYFKGEVLSIGMSNVFVIHKDEITKAFGEDVADEIGAAKIASAVFVGKWLGRQPLRPPRNAMDAAVAELFPKFMLDWVEYGFDYVLENHNITVCSVLSRYKFKVMPTGEMVFGRPKCTISDDLKDLLVNSLIGLALEYKEEEVETR